MSRGISNLGQGLNRSVGNTDSQYIGGVVALPSAADPPAATGMNYYAKPAMQPATAMNYYAKPAMQPAVGQPAVNGQPVENKKATQPNIVVLRAGRRYDDRWMGEVNELLWIRMIG